MSDQTPLAAVGLALGLLYLSAVLAVPVILTTVAYSVHETRPAVAAACALLAVAVFIGVSISGILTRNRTPGKAAHRAGAAEVAQGAAAGLASFAATLFVVVTLASLTGNAWSVALMSGACTLLPLLFAVASMMLRRQST